MHAHSFCMNVCGSRFVSAHYHIMWVTSRLNLGSTPFSAHFVSFLYRWLARSFPWAVPLLWCQIICLQWGGMPGHVYRDGDSLGGKWNLRWSNQIMWYDTNLGYWCASSFSSPWIWCSVDFFSSSGHLLDFTDYSPGGYISVQIIFGSKLSAFLTCCILSRISLVLYLHSPSISVFLWEKIIPW
jgi:hypothetical protein